MIVARYIKCSTCDHPHKVRIQVGVNPHQEHTFNCSNCTVPIKLILDHEAGVILKENCEFIAMTESKEVYLCADFVADKEDIDNSFPFPSARFIQDVIKNVGIDSLAKASKIEQIWDIQTTWNDVKKIWVLRDAGKTGLVSTKINELSQKVFPLADSFEKVLFDFYTGLMVLDEELNEHVLSALRTNEEELNKFLLFYKTSLRESHLRSQRQLLTTFFEGYTQFSQIMPYVRANIPITKNSVATLIEFDAVKTFYASAFEYYSDALVIFTAINNIKEGRPFDKLASINLEKWLSTDKGKRRDSFSGNPILTSRSQEFDNSLRNAIFHNWIFLNKDNVTLEYKNGGKGDLITLSYTEYLYKCGLLLKQICSLSIVELILFEVARRRNV